MEWDEGNGFSALDSLTHLQGQDEVYGLMNVRTDGSVN